MINATFATMNNSKTPIKTNIQVVRLTLFLFSMLLSPRLLFSQSNTYPTQERLFLIERSVNRNLVCYDVNLTDGKPNAKNPINVYWINREKEPGKKSSLNTIQRKLAYGYKVISQTGDSFEIVLTAHPAKKLIIKKIGKQYICTTFIGNQEAILQSLYVKTKEKNPLSVEYVELRGIDIDTETYITERVRNK